MNDHAKRIEAIKALLDKEPPADEARPVADAAVKVAEELLQSGDAKAALDVLEWISNREKLLSEEAFLRAELTKATAKIWVGEFIEALELSRRATTEYCEMLQAYPELAGRFTTVQGSCLWMLNQAEDSLAILKQLRADLLSKPDSALLSFCTVQLSAAYFQLGQFETATELAMDAVVSARRSGEKYTIAQALMNYCRTLRRACHWTEAAAAIQEALEIHRALGARHQANHALHGLALLRWKQGKLELAHELSGRCAEEAEALGNPTFRSLARLVKALVLIHLGRFDDAKAICVDTPGWSVLQGDSRAALLAGEYMADTLLEQGHAQEPAVLLQDLLTRAVAVLPGSDIVAELHRRIAECHLLLGQSGDAYIEARLGLEQTRHIGDRYEEAATHRLMALSAAAVGKPDEAKKWFDAGFAYYEDIQTPYEWGKLWMAYGDWLLGPHAGIHADRRGAHEAYLAAQDHFERIGAEAKLRQVNERLSKLVAAETAPATADLVRDAVRRSPRRPRRSLDLERRSAWAFETFRLVTRSPSMLALLEDVAKLARSDTPMLVLGESGTGKELVARGIHTLSGRKGTYMAINAGSLPREIIESELFGHVAGAFTGAVRDKVGIFEVCNKGTVFLDEIAEMSTELQSRLLRFLETGESRRVGANGNIAVDTRIIAATNRERRDLERGKDFRVDLYYRLAHAVIALPPLRQRGDDVRLLVEHFLAEACKAAGRQVELSPATMQSLVGYAWPGNVRQLRAVLKRVVLLAKEGRAVTPEQLELHHADVPTTLTGELEVEERRIVQEALVRADGSRTEAAKILGVPRTTLVNKIRRFGL